jgi:uncharacterized protein
MQITATGSSRIRPRNGKVIVIRNHAGSTFSRELARKEATIFDLDQLELDDLREDLQGMGESFENEPTLANFRIFREMIGRFAKKAISLAYRIEKIKNNRSNSILEIISVIDKNTDEILRMVMEGQRDRLFLASRISDINGMILRISA